MARAKRASDDVYNARRRLRRAAARAEREGNAQRAEQMRAAANQTYIGRNGDVRRAASAASAAIRRFIGGVADKGRAVLESLRSIVRSAPTKRTRLEQMREERVARDNDVFSHELNLASMDSPSSLDRPNLTGKAQARIFWLSTSKIWTGVEPEQRYDAIMRRLGTDSLRDAFNRVMRLNELALAIAEEQEREVRDTLRDMLDASADEAVPLGYSDSGYAYFVRDATIIAYV